MSPPPPSIRPPHPPRPRSLLSRPSRNAPLNLHQRSTDLITDTRLALLMVMHSGCGAHGGGSGGGHAVSVLLAPSVAAVAPATTGSVGGGHGGCVVGCVGSGGGHGSVMATTAE